MVEPTRCRKEFMSVRVLLCLYGQSALAIDLFRAYGMALYCMNGVWGSGKIQVRFPIEDSGTGHLYSTGAADSPNSETYFCWHNPPLEC